MKNLILKESLYQKAIQGLANQDQELLLSCFNEAPLFWWWKKIMSTQNMKLRDALRDLKGSPVHIKDNYGNSLLTNAVIMQNREMVEYLLNEGCSVKTYYQNRPLINLSLGWHANYEIAKLLLNHLKEPLPLEDSDTLKGSGLFSACFNSDPDLIDLLFSHSYPPDPNEIFSYDDINEIAWYSCKNIESLNVMVKNGAQLNRINAEDYWKHVSAYLSNAESIQMFDFWKSKGLPTEYFTLNPLHVACAFRNEVLVKWLLENGSDPNFLSGCNKEKDWEYPPLLNTLFFFKFFNEKSEDYFEKNLKIQKMLLDYGADPSLSFPYIQGYSDRSLLYNWFNLLLNYYKENGEEDKMDFSWMLSHLDDFLKMMDLWLSHPKSQKLIFSFFKDTTAMELLSKIIILSSNEKENQSIIFKKITMLLIQKADEINIFKDENEEELMQHLKLLSEKAIEFPNPILLSWFLKKNKINKKQSLEKQSSILEKKSLTLLHQAVYKYHFYCTRRSAETEIQLVFELIKVLLDSGENPLELDKDYQKTPLEIGKQIFNFNEEEPDFEKNENWSQLYMLLKSAEEKALLNKTMPSVLNNQKKENQNGSKIIRI